MWKRCNVVNGAGAQRRGVLEERGWSGAALPGDRNTRAAAPAAAAAARISPS